MMNAKPTTVAAQLLDQTGGGRRGPTGRHHVVHDQHLLARLHGIAVDLEKVGAVLELVLLPLDLPRQLARLAHRHESGTEPVGDGRGEDEPSGLDAEHPVDPVVGEVVRQRVDRRPERLRVAEERRDVLEGDAWLGEVRDVPDMVGQPADVPSHQRFLPFFRGRGGWFAE